MASITEYIIKLQELTQTNLEILQSLNDSFFTKHNHLSVNVGGSQFAIPSFISLENKINALSANFQNLVNAPESGEAFFNFDGNSRSIQVRPYTSTPNNVILNEIDEFSYENNDVFKDFLTPNPFVNLNLQSLPNDITQVVVKKVIPIHQDLINIFKGEIGEDKASTQYNYSELYKKLSQYESDKDYIEYDTKIDLPIRKNIGSATYVIEKVIEDIVDENLDNYITIKLRSDMVESIYMNSLKYRLFDETIEKVLKVGDQLTTYDGNAKMEITDIKYQSNILTVKVLHGEYLNLVESDANDKSNISSLSKIRFYSPIDFNEDKYIKVSLEEDRYVFITVAALNNRMNIQSSWGGGLLMDTYRLKCGEEKFDTYYKNNVRNIGDILNEISQMMSNTLTNHKEDEFMNFSNIVPIIDTHNISVVQINRHLNDSEAVKNIRASYAQKKNLQTQLATIDNEIKEVNTKLAETTFNDSSGTRDMFLSRLAELNSMKNNLNASISSILNDISASANNSEVPIENAKYRIRGYFDYREFLNNDELSSHVRGLKVQYRYKNVNQEQGLAMSINDKFIFSDWVDMKGIYRERVADFDDGYKFHIEEDNSNVNEPSFNQIDIPISQGETVDIRLKLVYDFGWPFIYTSSSWSPIINVKFPEEYLKDVKILDIIEENNNDIETNRFRNIIENEGIIDHINDKVNDQNIIYYHKPESIASGFYTAERRIIPLKDQLLTMYNDLIKLKDEIEGSNATNLTVSIKHGSNQNILMPYEVNNISVASYDSISQSQVGSPQFDGSYFTNGYGVVSTILNISLMNNSTHEVKLFSLFPANRDTDIYSITNTRFPKADYAQGEAYGVYFEYPVGQSKGQGGNQYIYFRVKDKNTGKIYYEASSGNNVWKDDVLDSFIFKPEDLKGMDVTGAYMYPKLNDKYGLCIPSDNIGSYISIAPGEEIIIPIVFSYFITNDEKDYGGTTMVKNSISKIMSFEICTSLYRDPVPYIFKVTAKYSDTTQDRVLSSNKSKFSSWWGSKDKKYSTTFK